jgi:hypothetical protein
MKLDHAEVIRYLVARGKETAVKEYSRLIKLTEVKFERIRAQNPRADLILDQMSLAINAYRSVLAAIQMIDPEDFYSFLRLDKTTGEPLGKHGPDTDLDSCLDPVQDGPAVIEEKPVLPSEPEPVREIHLMAEALPVVSENPPCKKKRTKAESPGVSYRATGSM